MKTLYFKCKLLTDVIISQSSATVGHQSTLDFIPGSNFLGICACAKNYSDLSKEEKLLMFHTGDVQFGDAHPMHKGVRTLRIPASMYYPKIKSMEDECYIHHGHEHIEGEQLKQCRNGFYAFVKDELKAYKKDVKTDFAIKSAYDYDKRRSMDKQMYGYESMEKGLEFLFEVRISDKAEVITDKIKKFLDGEKTIGRSKTAQYGRVKIEEIEEIEETDKKKKHFQTYGNTNSSKSYSGEDIQVVYADSRLIFIDEKTKLPTFRPTPIQLGFDDGEIAWEYCQIRTFQYAPWNAKRKTYDADRCGIEKGSVIAIRTANIPSQPEDVVGSFKNEGFGKVIYNPSFLEFEKDGLAKWKIENSKSQNNNKEHTLTSTSSTLLKYISERQRKISNDKEIMRIVNDFVTEKNLKLFGGVRFASQWGTIRSIALKHRDSEVDAIYKEIFEEKTGYLEHGVAKDKWEKCGGKIALKKFIDSHKKVGLRKLLINLASEMQKAIKNKEYER